MSPNASAAWEESPVLNSSSSSSSPCGHDMASWERRMDEMYSYFYLLLFIPGLLLNTTALWVLCRHISKKTKAVIFMINLALADLAHILSLPLRIHYYFTHAWPFGRAVCLFCFYLKYLNMYAAIVFLVCISVQRCVFLLHPFSARRWRRRYDLAISATVWVLVGLACSPFILMRSTDTITNTTTTNTTTTTYNASYPPPANAPPGCFKDLPMRHLPVSLAVAMMALAELFGFLIPLACISYSYVRIARSLRQTAPRDPSDPPPRDPSDPPPPAAAAAARARLRSFSGGGRQADGRQEKHGDGEKRRALRMVLGCSALFLLCFAPYHVNFLLYLMVSQDIVSHCATELAVRRFHPVSLCLASLSCCLNPLLYYFLTAEFRLLLARRTSSFSASLLSSPPPTAASARRPAPRRLTSMESSGSDRE